MRLSANCALAYLIGLHIFTATFALNKMLIRAARAVYSHQYFTNFTLYSLNGTLYSDIYMRQELVAGFKVRLDVQYRLPDSQRYQSLFGYQIDVCGTKIAMRDNMMRRILKSLLRYGNFMENCPVPSGHYYLHGWHMEPSLVPSYLHSGDYRIKGRGYFGGRRSANKKFVVNCEIDATLI